MVREQSHFIVYETISQGIVIVDRISFDGQGRGFAYFFTQLPQSEGYWGCDSDDKPSYAIANIQFDVIPVNLTVEAAK